jgi:hypothetical protein
MGSMSRDSQLVEWDSYLCKSSHGTILAYASLQKFKDELNYFLLLTRAGNLVTSAAEVLNMALVDWNAIHLDKRFQDKKGKFDPETAVDWFRSEMEGQIKAAAEAHGKRLEREKNRAKMIHRVFDEAGGDKEKLQLDFVIKAVISMAGVGWKDIAEEESKIKDYLFNEETKEFAYYSAGPYSGIVRAKREDGTVSPAYAALSSSQMERSKLTFGLPPKKTRGSQD